MDRASIQPASRVTLSGEACVMRIFVQLTRALRYIHSMKSLHLDIKPQNLFLVRSHIKVADFGLVKDLEGFSAAVTGGWSGQ